MKENKKCIKYDIKVLPIYPVIYVTYVPVIQHHHTIKVPIAGEGAVRSEIEKSVPISRLSLV
ncbi:hypothetical protein Lmor_1113 [Legionella moravica]|uniref:Uncharacterized protein n=1 Tax=Legionella moravica TaxID=39962 RepID=A0A378JWI4_9GAMM|nr:hypothetical protein Lmor_1113 [Legionella moravica]STX62796.1 Uncharacterised protein [Legionella moravica]